jgi:hypothetical protein
MPRPVRDRDSIRIARDCWVAASDSGSLRARCVAALGSSAENTVVVGPTAARLHGFWLPDLPDEVHLATAHPMRAARAMTRTRRPEFNAHRRTLSRDTDIVLLDGVLVSAPARTWVDLASTLGLADLVAAGDSALRAGAALESLADAIGRSSRLRGVRRAREAFTLLDARSRSRPESHLRLAASAPDLPPFAVNEAVFRAEGGWLAEPDLSLAEARIALEYQGADHAELTRMHRDITRLADLRREGWTCLLYGPAEVFGRPGQIAPEVRSLVRARAPHLLRDHERRVVTRAASGHK